MQNIWKSWYIQPRDTLKKAQQGRYCYGGIFVTSRFLEQFKEAKRMFEFDTVEEALEENLRMEKYQ